MNEVDSLQICPTFSTFTFSDDQSMVSDMHTVQYKKLPFSFCMTVPLCHKQCRNNPHSVNFTCHFDSFVLIHHIVTFNSRSLNVIL